MSDERLERQLDGLYSQRLDSMPDRLLRDVMAIPDTVPRVAAGRSRFLMSLLTSVAALTALAGVLGLQQLAEPNRRDPVAAPPSVTIGSSPSATLLPQGRTIVVAEDGRGDTRSVQEAIAIAQDGDTILVRPPIDGSEGVYVEAGLTIDKDVTIRGDGPRDAIGILLATPSRPQYLDLVRSLIVLGADATIENVGLSPERIDTPLMVARGTLRLRDVRLSSSVVETERSTSVVVEGSDLVNVWINGSGMVSVHESNLIDSCLEASNEGAALDVRDNNVLWRGPDEGDGVSPAGRFCPQPAFVVSERGEVVVQSNTIEGTGIQVRAGLVAPVVVRDNTIVRATTAVDVSGGRDVDIDGNVLAENGTAIALANAPASVTRNRLTGNRIGLEAGGSAADVRANEFGRNEVAIAITGTTPAPTFTENVVCGNATAVRVLGNRQISLEGGQVCAEDKESALADYGTGPALAWERVEPGFEILDEYADESPRWDGTSFWARDPDLTSWGSSDGRSWDRQDTVHERSWYVAAPLGSRPVIERGESSVLTIQRPDGGETKQTFRGPIDAVAVSPAGIVVIERVRFEDVVADIAARPVDPGTWRLVTQEGGEHPSPASAKGGTGTRWIVESPDGELVRLELTEQGYGTIGPDEEHVATLGWYSADGTSWSAIRGVAMAYEDTLVGTDAGIWWLHGFGDQGLWFSSNGRDWTLIGDVDGWQVHPWLDGVLVRRESGGLLQATPDGLVIPPFSREVPTELVEGLAPAGGTTMSVGTLGLVLLDERRGVSIFSPDGIGWGLTDAPWDLHDGSHLGDVAVGAEAVLVAVHHHCNADTDADGCRTRPDTVTELWRGAPEP